jgi:CBS domain containing-hemolysin-like protein
MVTDEFGAVSGLVTLEDIIETVLGIEIVDESDQTVDMRQLAMKLRDKRLKQMRLSVDEEPISTHDSSAQDRRDSGE